MIVLALMLAVQDTSRLTLDDAVRRALGQYPTVSAARAARDGASADLRDARSQSLPRLTLNATATQNQLPSLVFPLHGFPTGANAPATSIPEFERTLFQGSAQASWVLWDFGARRGRAQAGRDLVGAADAALGAAEQQLAARTANAYLAVLTARQELEAHDLRIRALAAEAERTRRLLADGKAARLDVLRADAELARARADRSATAGQLDVAEHDLAQLVSLPWAQLNADTLPGVRLTDTTEAATLRARRAGLVDAAVATSPELRQVQRRANAARAGLSAAKATRLPEIRATAGIVDRGATGTDFRAEWQAGIGVSYPLYTGGQRGGAIDRAAADARVADEQLRLAELNLTQSVDRAIAQIIQARARVEALESAVEHSQAVVEIERTALDVGSGTQTDYLDALSLALQARSQEIEARHAEIAARIELARVTGVLSPAWIANHVESDR